MKLTVVIGSATKPGRLHKSCVTLGELAKNRAVPTEYVDLSENRLELADGRPPEAFDPPTSRAIEVVLGAEAVVFASPVYRASFTGALKNFLDLLPIAALKGKPCGIMAMGSTTHHYLAVDNHLRSVLAWFGALVLPTSIYSTPEDFAEDGSPSVGFVSNCAALISSLERLHAAAATGPLGPEPLAGRH